MCNVKNSCERLFDTQSTNRKLRKSRAFYRASNSQMQRDVLETIDRVVKDTGVYSFELDEDGYISSEDAVLAEEDLLKA